MSVCVCVGGRDRAPDVGESLIIVGQLHSAFKVPETAVILLCVVTRQSKIVEQLGRCCAGLHCRKPKILRDTKKSLEFADSIDHKHNGCS